MSYLVRKDRPKVRIVGTLEHVTGVAGIVGARRDLNGTLEFDLDYDGNTDINWDSQETVRRKSRRVFVDANGDEVLESNITLVEKDDDENQDD